MVLKLAGCGQKAQQLSGDVRRLHSKSLHVHRFHLCRREAGLSFKEQRVTSVRGEWKGRDYYVNMHREVEEERFMCGLISL